MQLLDSTGLTSFLGERRMESVCPNMAPHCNLLELQMIQTLTIREPFGEPYRELDERDAVGRCRTKFDALEESRWVVDLYHCVA